jgi:7-alpha-hydroxysteroid dehydrogenase
MSILDAFRLEDQVAVVTGAGAGIGRAVAELFSKAGAKVVVSDLKAEAAQEVANIIQKSIGAAVPVACNVTEDAARTHLVQQAMDAFGKITILVNNAGGGGPKPFGMPMETFIWAFKLNVFSVFHLYQL